MTIFQGKRIDTGDRIEGHYFTAPLTVENVDIPIEHGHFFLSDGITRHCIEKDGVVYEVEPDSIWELRKG